MKDKQKVTKGEAEVIVQLSTPIATACDGMADALIGEHVAIETKRKAIMALVVAVKGVERTTVLRAQMIDRIEKRFKKGSGAGGGSVSGIITKVFATATALELRKLPANIPGMTKLANAVKAKNDGGIPSVHAIYGKINAKGEVRPKADVAKASSKGVQIDPADKPIVKLVRNGGASEAMKAIKLLVDRLSIGEITNLQAYLVAHKDALHHPAKAKANG